MLVLVHFTGHILVYMVKYIGHWASWYFTATSTARDPIYWPEVSIIETGPKEIYGPQEILR